MSSSVIQESLTAGLSAFDRPATTREIEAAMPIALSSDHEVAVARCRIALRLRAVLEQDVRRLPEDRWERSRRPLQP